MFRQQNKKKPPPRPPPPNFSKFKSKSSYNLNQNINLIEWSPPNSPKVQKSRQYMGSVSSSHSSSASSLASSKKSFEYDLSPINWVNSTPTTSEQYEKSNNNNKPTIIRANKINNKKIENNNGNESPPMPSIPPPSPPKGACEVVTPYGIALFDYPASHPTDLTLQENDVIILIKRINNDWLYGKIGNQEGIFPSNFIQIIVPLPGEEKLYTVLYNFESRVPGDLELKAGQLVKVIRQISKEWLFGECEGRSGQFPTNFVDFS